MTVPAGLKRSLWSTLDVWVTALGDREEAKLHLLAAFAEFFDDEPDEGPPPLELENRELRARLDRVRSLQAQDLAFVDRVRREALAHGAPVAVDDLAALESVLLSGSPRTADAFARLLVERARQEGPPPEAQVQTSILDVGDDDDAARAERRGRAQDRLYELATRSRPPASLSSVPAAPGVPE